MTLLFLTRYIIMVFSDQLLALPGSSYTTTRYQERFVFFFCLLVLVCLYEFPHYHPFLPDLQPAPPVGFNVTFVCPEGQVFDHDWFASAFVLITCGLNGAFDAPDWSGYSCVLREYMTTMDNT